MKPIFAFAAAAILVGCGETASIEPAEGPNATTLESADIVSDAEIAVPTYDEDVWYVSAGWPGEYPPGFSIFAEGVSVPARVGMHDSLPADLTCALPQNATYQLWNQARVEADGLDFITVSEKFDITISETAEIDAPAGEFDNPNNTLKLEPGDRLTYLRYLGEGWTLMEINGEERDVNEMDLMEISDIRTAGETTSDDILWINIPCGDTRGWLTLDEALADPGILMTPIIGYGVSRDMTEQDRLEAVAQAKWAEQSSSGD